MKEVVVETADGFCWLLKMAGLLLWALRTSTHWVFLMFRLIAFVVLLMPAFLQATAYCWLHPSVDNFVRYGPKRRNLMDIYKLKQEFVNSGEARPVVVFMTGGVWIIGYKMWGMLMGALLQRLGILLIVPDYRNFPQVRANEMLDDTALAVQWCFDNCADYGGDPKRLYLVGQSAGAHLLAQVLLQRCVTQESSQQCSAAPKNPTWQLRDVRAFMGISGPFDLVGMTDHFHSRGLDRRLLSSIFEHRVTDFSPVEVARTWAKQGQHYARRLPPTLLVHGTGDKSCPSTNAMELEAALQAAGSLSVGVKLYEGKSHTDPIIEDPINGDDPLIQDLALLVFSDSPAEAIEMLGASGSPGAFGPEEAKLSLLKRTLLPSPLRARMLPAPLIRLARKVNPF
jgi:prenylcysteine alpha-carboxyl methylesterase